VRTLAVTPPAPVEITAEVAGGMGLPACAVGLTYYGESVPTDIALEHGTKKVRTYAEVNMPAAVEWSPRGLYATVDVLVGPSEESPDTPPGGRLVRYRS
jgi:hypothetical protein